MMKNADGRPHIINGLIGLLASFDLMTGNR